MIVLNAQSYTLPEGNDLSISSSSSSPTVCGGNDGTIQITSPIGSNYLYQLEGFGGFTTNTTFTGLAADIYTINVQTASGDCFTFTTQTVSEGPDLNISTTPTLPSQCGAADGQLRVTSPTGSEFQYSINNGSFQSSPIFSGLIGNTYKH